MGDDKKASTGLSFTPFVFAPPSSSAAPPSALSAPAGPSDFASLLAHATASPGVVTSSTKQEESSLALALKQMAVTEKQAKSAPPSPTKQSAAQPRDTNRELAMWERLPTDVLALIFDFLYHRPRLLVLACVCRRWNATVLRSVTRFRPKDDFALRSCLVLLPSLRSLHLRWPPSYPLVLPSTLRQLSISSVYIESRNAAKWLFMDSNFLKHVQFHSLLTSLSVSSETSLNGSTLLPTQAYLRRLKLRCSDVPGLESLHFPTLVHLSIHPSRQCLSVVSAHASQLTALTLLHHYDTRTTAKEVLLTASPSYPHLRLLKLSHLETAWSSDEVASLCQRCPMLSSVTGSANFLRGLTVWGSLLTKIDVEVNGSEQRELHDLHASCPRVKSLRIIRPIHGADPPRYILQSDLAGVLTAIHVSVGDEDLSHLTSLTSLRDLTLTFNGSIQKTPPPSLPSLLHLSLWFTHVTTPSFDLLERLINTNSVLYSPKLQSLDVQFPCGVREGNVITMETLLAYLSGAERRCLERATFTSTLSFALPGLVAKHKFAWVELAYSL